MSPQPPAITEPTSALIGTAITVAAAVWAAMRWLLWPRIKETIRAEVDAACAPLREEMHEHVVSMDQGIQRIARLMEALTERVHVHGERIAATGAAVDILVERRSGYDRRRDDSA